MPVPGAAKVMPITPAPHSELAQRTGSAIFREDQVEVTVGTGQMLSLAPSPETLHTMAVAYP